MKAVGRYDGDLQMFVEETKNLDMNRLWYLRFLAERGDLEHPIAGPCTGEIVADLVFGGPAPVYSGKA
jgi:hypothetical protein